MQQVQPRDLMQDGSVTYNDDWPSVAGGYVGERLLVIVHVLSWTSGLVNLELRARRMVALRVLVSSSILAVVILNGNGVR